VLCAFLGRGRYIGAHEHHHSKEAQNEDRRKKAPRRFAKMHREIVNDLTLGFSTESGVGVRKKRNKKTSAEESMLRSERVRRGDANNRIEGISSDPRSDAVFSAYISGEIEVTEIVPQLKRLYRVP
jgi:hypothetical protein